MSGKHEEGGERRDASPPQSSVKSHTNFFTDRGGSVEYGSGVLLNTPTKFAPEINISHEDFVKNTNSKVSETSNTNLNSPKIKSRNIKYFRLMRNIKKNVVSSVITDQLNDNRPSADVHIAGSLIRGLLDSGSSITVLGCGSEEFVSNIGVCFYNQPSLLSTASGASQRILGHIRTLVSYNGKKRTMRIFIAPGLQQKLYHGIGL